jgi:hypothetical protein
LCLSYRVATVGVYWRVALTSGSRKGELPGVHPCHASDELAIQVVDGLADGTRDLACGIFDRSDGLISHALIGEVGIAGKAAEAFFEFAGDVGSSAGEALLCTPRGDVIGGVIDAVVAGGVLRGATAEENIGDDPGGGASDEPSCGRSFRSA